MTTEAGILTEEQRWDLRELAGASLDGWTEEDVEWLDRRLQEAIGYGCVVVWDHCDMYGADGDSDIRLVGNGYYELPDGLWELLTEAVDDGTPEAAAFIDNCIARIDADLPHLTPDTEYNWDTLYGMGPNLYFSVDDGDEEEDDDAEEEDEDG